MDGSDLVVAVGVEQDEVLQIRPGQHILEQIERRGVEPLQLIEEESIRARSFLCYPTLAAPTQEPGGERMVNRAGPGARPDTVRTPHPAERFEDVL